MRLLMWLLSWFFRGERSRLIYHFWDGQKFRKIDPLVVWRVLDTHPEFSHRLHSEYAWKNYEDMAVLTKAVRDAFLLPVYDGVNGLTEAELYNLYHEYMNYAYAVKKNGVVFPIWSPATEMREHKLRTKNTSDDTSTEKESGIDNPPSS